MEPELEYRVILHGPMKWKVSEPLKNAVCVNTPYLVIYEPMAGILQLSQGTLTVNSFKMYGSKRDESQILSIWLFASLDDAEMAVAVLSKMMMEKCTIVNLCKLSEVTSVLCKALTSFHLLLEFVINNIKRSLSDKIKVPKDGKVDPILESYSKCSVMSSFSLRVGLFDVVSQVNEKTDLMEHLYRGMNHKGAGINRLSFSFYEVSQPRGHTFNNFLGYDLLAKNARNMSDPVNIDLLDNMTNNAFRSITTNVNPGGNSTPASIMPAVNSSSSSGVTNLVERSKESSSRTYCSKVTIPTSQANRSITFNTLQIPNETYKQLCTTYGTPVSIVNRCLNNSTSKYPPILNDTTAGDKVLGVIDLDNSPTNDNFYHPVDPASSPNTPTINSYPSTNIIPSENTLDSAGLSIDTNEWVDKRLYNDLVGRFKIISEENTKWHEKYQRTVTKLNTQMSEVRRKYANELEKLKYNYDTEVLSLKSYTKELKERYEGQIAIIRNNNEKEILKVRCGYEDAIEDLKNKHQTFIKNLQLKHDNELNEQLMVHDNNINDLKKNYQAQLDMMKKSFDNEIDMKKKGYDAEIVDMRRGFQNEILDLKRSQQIELRDKNSLTYNVMEENEELYNKVKVLQSRVLALENEIKRLENISKMQELNEHFRESFQLRDTEYKMDLGDSEPNNDLLRREMKRVKGDWSELYVKLSARLFYSMITQVKLKRECTLLKLQNTFLKENRIRSTFPLINTIMRCKGKIAKRTCQLHRIVRVLGLSGPTTITGITTRIQLLNQMFKDSKCNDGIVKSTPRNEAEALERRLRKFSEILENQRFSIENNIASISDFKKKKTQLLAQNESLVREIKEMLTMIIHSSPQRVVSKAKRPNKTPTIV